MKRDRVVWVDVEGIVAWFPAGASILPVSESGKTVVSKMVKRRIVVQILVKTSGFLYSPKCWDWLSDRPKFLFKNPEAALFMG